MFINVSLKLESGMYFEEVQNIVLYKKRRWGEGGRMTLN